MKVINLVTFISAGLLILSGCSQKSNTGSTASGSPATDSASAAIPVKTIALEKTRISRTVDYTATILPYEEVNMAPSAPGRIEAIYVEVGDKVNKGDRLFLMDRTQLYQLRLQLANLEKDLQRLDTLLKSGSAKQQQYDQMKTQYDVTKTNADFMEHNTLMKSPFSGIVTGKYYEDGEVYSGAPSSPSGKSAVVTVMQVNPLKLDVSISEQFYPLIKKGMKASVTADVYPGETFTGTVFRIAPTINSATRTFSTEIELPNRNDLLKPGMFVRVAMDLGEVETFAVPASAVMIQEGTNIRYVFVSADGIARRIEVLPGKRFDEILEVISEELKPGDQVITEGQARLINGDRIEVVK